MKIDPRYPDAWGWLAYMYAEEHHHRWNARPEVYDALEWIGSGYPTEILRHYARG